MTAQKVFDGLAIILRCEPKAHASAEHDMLYAGSMGSPNYSAADRAALEALGWGPDQDDKDIPLEDGPPWSFCLS